MKLHRIASLNLIVLLLFTVFSFANAGPSYWEGHPSGGILSIDQNTSISVEEENLIIDFSFNDHPDASELFKSDFSPVGMVTAEYRMYNSSEESQIVQMAFPFVERLDNLHHHQNSITVDDEAINFKIYDAGLVDEHKDGGDFDFAAILGKISESPYEAKHFSENQVGKLYTIELNQTSNIDSNVTTNAISQMEYEIEFTFNPEKTKIITKGFHGFQRKDDNTIKNTVWLSEFAKVKLLVLGEDIDIKEGIIKGNINTSEQDLKSFIIDFIDQEGLLNNGLSETQNYNIYSKALDLHLDRNSGYVSDNDLVDMKTWDRVFAMVYTVEFPPETSKTLKVDHYSYGTMDRRKTKKPTFSYDYIWNPAENWKDFKNLNLTITTPQEAPYIVQSNIELISPGENTYTATFDSLPEGNLNFVLFEKPSTVEYRKYASGFIIIVMLGLLFVVRKIRKKYLH